MFEAARRMLVGVPLASAAIGLAEQPLVLALPPALVALHVLARDRILRRKISATAWPSDGFARHVLVDDLCRLALLTLIGLPMFFLGLSVRATLFA